MHDIMLSNLADCGIITDFSVNTSLTKCDLYGILMNIVSISLLQGSFQTCKNLSHRTGS